MNMINETPNPYYPTLTRGRRIGGRRVNFLRDIGEAVGVVATLIAGAALALLFLAATPDSVNGDGESVAEVR